MLRLRLPLLLAALIAVLLASAPPALAQPDPGAGPGQALVGDWQGTLSVGVELRLVLHVTAEGDRLAATLDSPDQAAFGLAAAGVVVEADSFWFTVPSVGGRFAGLVRGDTLDGAWSQGGMEWPLAFTRHAEGDLPAPRPSVPDPAGLAGDWGGRLDMGAFYVPLVLHLRYDGTAYAALLDSPDQGAFGIPAEGALVRTADGAADSLVVTVAAASATLAGRVAADRDSIEAAWTQGGTPLPITLTREGAALTRRRPQEPRPPFPYTAEEVTFPGGEGVTLAGTLTRPEGAGPFPAAVLVSGSGQQDRDETVMGHRPFAVLADALTRRGVLVLRYDDRGVGGSSPGPDLLSATSADFAEDALGAVRFLAARPDVRTVGVVGHSEGGVIAPLVAGQTDDVGFVVLLAGPAVRGDAVIARQGVLIAEAAGVSAAGAAALEAPTLGFLARVVAVPLGRPLPDSVRAAVQADVLALTAAMPPEDRRAAGLEGGLEADSAYAAGMAEQLALPWMRYFLAYDPAPALRALRVPALALFGEKDLQVPPEQSAGPMREALSASASPQWDVVVLDGLNHLFQTAETGAMAEYAEIEETMSPAALDAVADWVLALE